MEKNKKSRPPFYGVIENEDGTPIDYGTLIEEGKCEYVGDSEHWNFEKNKIYEYAYIMKTENVYVYTIFGEEMGIETIAEHFMTYFKKE